jgi:hypothetical protein
MDRFSQIEAWLIRATALLCLLTTLLRVLKHELGF